MKAGRIISSVLAAAILLTGCAKGNISTVSEMTASPSTSESLHISETSETSETVYEPPFEYNPHLYSALIATEVPQENWDSLYNLADALRAGEDTFECSSQEAYDWCMDSGILANLIPAACMKISGISNDGTAPYEDGFGRIYYEMPVEEFVQRENEFEEAVEDVLNTCLEKDDTDFEKCLKLYDYMESNYYYDYDGTAFSKSGDGYVYYTFFNHTGQCIDFGSLYAFLLLQAGVEAISVGCFDELDHEWTYVVIDGQGYHIDPTWALKEGYTGDLSLDYFMMSDDIRTETGCPVTDLTVQLLPGFWLNNSSLTLPATDESYYAGLFTTLERLDEDNKILYYTDADGSVLTLDYGEL